MLGRGNQSGITGQVFAAVMPVESRQKQDLLVDLAGMVLARAEGATPIAYRFVRLPRSSRTLPGGQNRLQAQSSR